jgi:peroxiredoxin family protein
MAIMASGGVAMDMDVDIFATFYGLNAFTKQMVHTNTRFSKDFEEMAPMITELMKQKNVPSWYEMLKKAKESGNVKIHACSTAADLLNITKDMLDPIVDDVVGVGNYLAVASASQVTLFI